MFSFTPTKNITMGEGGIVTTNDGAIAEAMRLLRNHGQTSRYRHERLGYNWRLTEMQAAMGMAQLDRLEGIIETKRSNARWMVSRLGHLPSIRLPAELPSRKHVYMLYTILLERNRDGVLQSLLDRGIEARVYFPPAHLQPVFEGGPSLPITEDLSKRILSLPFHSQLTGNELEEIAVGLEQALANFDLP